MPSEREVEAAARALAQILRSDIDEQLMKSTLLKCYGSTQAFRVSSEHYRYLAEQVVSLREHIKRLPAALSAAEGVRKEEEGLPSRFTAGPDDDLINDLSCMFFDAQTVKSVPSDYAKAAIARVRRDEDTLRALLAEAGDGLEECINDLDSADQFAGHRVTDQRVIRRARALRAKIEKALAG
jgi:hypothetical protein